MPTTVKMGISDASTYGFDGSDGGGNKSNGSGGGDNGGSSVEVVSLCRFVDKRHPSVSALVAAAIDPIRAIVASFGTAGFVGGVVAGVPCSLDLPPGHMAAGPGEIIVNQEIDTNTKIPASQYHHHRNSHTAPLISHPPKGVEVAVERQGASRPPPKH